MTRLIVLSALALALLATGCQKIAGRECDTSNPCPSGYGCAPANDGIERCMVSCDPTAGSVCHDGKACISTSGTSGTVGVCYLGGNVLLNESCMSPIDCTQNTVCAQSMATDPPTCRIGCNTDGSRDCASPQFCQVGVGGIDFCVTHTSGP